MSDHGCRVGKTYPKVEQPSAYALLFKGKGVHIWRAAVPPQCFVERAIAIAELRSDGRWHMTKNRSGAELGTLSCTGAVVAPMIEQAMIDKGAWR